MIGILIGALSLVAIGWLRKKQQKSQVEQAQTTAARIIEEAKKEAVAIKKEAEIQAKDRILQAKTDFENEIRETRKELQALEKRLVGKEESLDKRIEGTERRESDLARREQSIRSREKGVEEKQAEYERVANEAKQQLEQVAGMTREEAKRSLIDQMVEEAKHDSAKRIRVIEEEAREEAVRKGQKIVALAIERLAGDFVAERTVTVVPLPSDEMKGRIIGREGRNIRALEAATGIDLIIDDTPEAVVLSGFDPVRREVARMTLEKLFSDGRIHPARIEETVARSRADIQLRIKEEGERAAMDANVHGLQPELLKILGRLHFRTSYGQNVLAHSVEVSILAGTIAHELGADVNVCKTAALLHDMGKAIDQEVEGPHAII